MDLLSYCGLRTLYKNILAKINKKQDKLVSGESIKTINGKDVLGSGDITISEPEGVYIQDLEVSASAKEGSYVDAKVATNGNNLKFTFQIPPASKWTIGDDGYWYLNGQKTNIKAVGEDGEADISDFDVTAYAQAADIAEASVTKGKKSLRFNFNLPKGEKGDPGTEWIIGADGYWYKDGVKTSNYALGSKGDPGTAATVPVFTRFVYIYKVQDEQPSTPTGGSWEITLGTFTCPSGWAMTYTLSDETDTVWMSCAQFSSDTGEIVGVWSTPIPLQGKEGQAGSDTSDKEYVYIRTTDQNDGTNLKAQTYTSPQTDGYVPTNVYGSQTWTDHPQGVTETLKAEWIMYRTATTNSSGVKKWGSWIGPVLWSRWGENGKDGDGVEYIFQRTPTFKAPDTPTFTSSFIAGSIYQADDYVPTGWTDDPTGVDKENCYEWVCTRKRDWSTGKWKAFEGSYADSSKAALWAMWGGNDGDPGIYMKTAYLKVKSGSDVPTLTVEEKSKTTVPSPWKLAYEYEEGYVIYCIHAYFDYKGNFVIPYLATEEDIENGNYIEDAKGNKISCEESADSEGNTTKVQSGGWLGPYPLTGYQGKTGYAPNYTTIVFKAVQTVAEVTAGAAINTSIEAPAVNSDPLPEGWYDYPDDNAEITVGEETKTGPFVWWQCVGNVDGVTNTVTEWGTVQRVTFFDGEAKDGPYYDVRFCVNESRSDAPGITTTADNPGNDWVHSFGADEVSPGRYVWETMAYMNADGTLKEDKDGNKGWCNPFVISGEAGESGRSIVNLYMYGSDDVVPNVVNQSSSYENQDTLPKSYYNGVYATWAVLDDNLESVGGALSTSNKALYPVLYFIQAYCIYYSDGTTNTNGTNYKLTSDWSSPRKFSVNYTKEALTGSPGQNGVSGVPGAEIRVMYIWGPSKETKEENGYTFTMGNTSSLTPDVTLKDSGGNQIGKTISWSLKSSEALNFTENSGKTDDYDTLWWIQCYVRYTQDTDSNGDPIEGNYTPGVSTEENEGWSDPMVWNGTDGKNGNNGRVLYPAGIYSSAAKYSMTDDTVPYVYYGDAFYIYNNPDATWYGPDYKSESGETGITTQTTTPAESSAWVKMDGFTALFTKLALIQGGSIGSAYFYDDVDNTTGTGVSWMFSTKGYYDDAPTVLVSYADAANTERSDYATHHFDPDNMYTKYDGTTVTTYYWHPNVAIDFFNGHVYDVKGIIKTTPTTASVGDYITVDKDGNTVIGTESGKIIISSSGNLSISGDISAEGATFKNLKIDNKATINDATLTNCTIEKGCTIKGALEGATGTFSGSLSVGTKNTQGYDVNFGDLFTYDADGNGTGEVTIGEEQIVVNQDGTFIKNLVEAQSFYDTDTTGGLKVNLPKIQNDEYSKTIVIPCYFTTTSTTGIPLNLVAASDCRIQVSNGAGGSSTITEGNSKCTENVGDSITVHILTGPCIIFLSYVGIGTLYDNLDVWYISVVGCSPSDVQLS